MKSWGKRFREKGRVKGESGLYLGEFSEGPGMVFTRVVTREVG